MLVAVSHKGSKGGIGEWRWILDASKGRGAIKEDWAPAAAVLFSENTLNFR
jgi:hypothetical protein